MAKYEHGKKARLTINLNKGLYHRLKELAECRDGNVSAVIEECVARALSGLEVNTSVNQNLLIDKLVTELVKPETLSRAMKIASMCTGKDVDPDAIDDMDELMGNVPKKIKQRRA
ncbi:MAG: hypothetical protein K8S55_06640 [Phycisphaerae bacterium]|nr:hypothetical protein [Phycisphaerae bacterium]